MAKKTETYSPPDQTLQMLTAHIVATLDRAAGDDENIDALADKCRDLEVDTSRLNEERILANPVVQEAFAKFVSDMISTCQMLEEQDTD
jgi:hypothetical protein